MDDNHALLVNTLSKDNERSYKYYKYRLSLFADWLTKTGRHWDTLDLPIYRTYLLGQRGFAPSTVNSHLSSIRTCYKALIDNRTLQTALETTLPDELSTTERAERVQEKTKDIERQLDAHDIRLKKENRPTDYLRLNAEHLGQLLEGPDRNTLVGLRDAAIITLLVTTGLRENELCELNVENLDFGDKCAVHIPEGKGHTPRTIRPGRFMWRLELVQSWLERANITQGPVFRGFFKGGQSIRPSRLSPRAVEYILAAYPITVDGKAVAVRVMDLRRVNARILYEAGVEPAEIKKMVGLRDSNALFEYIGPRPTEFKFPGGTVKIVGIRFVEEWG